MNWRRDRKDETRDHSLSLSTTPTSRRRNGRFLLVSSLSHFSRSPRRALARSNPPGAMERFSLVGSHLRKLNGKMNKEEAERGCPHQKMQAFHLKRRSEWKKSTRFICFSLFFRPPPCRRRRLQGSLPLPLSWLGPRKEEQT